jgi:hypothetical protein
MAIPIQRREEAPKAYRDSLAMQERLTGEELRTSGLAASLPVARCAAAGNCNTVARSHRRVRSTMCLSGNSNAL